MPVVSLSPVKTLIYLKVVLFLSSPALATFSVPSPLFRQELENWGIGVDQTLRLTAGPLIRTSYSRNQQAGIDVIHDVYFEIDAANIPAVARQLAIDRTQDELEQILTENFRNGHTQIPLTPFLPRPARDRFGTRDRHACHYSTFNFSEDGNAAMGIDFDQPLDMEKVETRYSDFAYGEKVQYGDILAFRNIGHPTRGHSVFHSVRYLGGDLVYHTFAPDEVFGFEYSTLDSLFQLYSFQGLTAAERAVMDRQTSFTFGDPFLVHFFRFDPNKLMPPPKSNPRPPRVCPAAFGEVSMYGGPQTTALEKQERSRNAPCFCGSGKKFKKCHGRH